MHFRRVFAAFALSVSGVAACPSGRMTNARNPQPPLSDGVSVFRGRVETLERRDTTATWQIAVRVRPTGRTSGVVFVTLAANRSVVRDQLGTLRRLPGVKVGNSVTAWVHGAVLLSDPPYAFAESLRVAP
jgi:hypothetical protein